VSARTHQQNIDSFGVTVITVSRFCFAETWCQHKSNQLLLLSHVARGLSDSCHA